MIKYLTKNKWLYIRDHFSEWAYWTVWGASLPDDIHIHFRNYIEEINKKPLNANADYISWFMCENDVERTLEVMEQIGWTWVSGQKPTQWHQWKNNFRWSKGWSLGNHDDFWQNSIRKIDPSDLYFEDFIKIHTTNPAPETLSVWKVEVTFDNIKNFIWKKFTGIKGGEPIEWVIVDKPRVWVRFNTRFNNWWETTDCPWYKRWWNISDKWDLSNIKSFMIISESESEPDPTADIEIPKYFYIKRDNSNVLWEEYIKWLNETYSCEWSWTEYVYYWYDGSSGSWGTDCHYYSRNFENNAKEITLEFWNKYMNDMSDPELPVTATEATQSHEVPLSKFDSSDPEAGKKWRVEYWIGPTNIIDTSKYYSAVLPGCAWKAGDVIYVDDHLRMAAPYLAPKVPVKKSRYSSMLDLI